MNCNLYFCLQPSSYLWETSCLIYVVCVSLRIVVSSACCVFVFLHIEYPMLPVSLNCSFCLPLRCSLTCVFVRAYSGVQCMLCCVFGLFYVVLCILCYQFPWNVHVVLPLRYSITFIFYIWTFIVWFHFQLSSSLSPTSHCQVTNTKQS